MSNQQAVVFCDLDGTLIRGSALFVVGRAAMRHGYIRPGQIIKGSIHELRFRAFGEQGNIIERLRPAVMAAGLGVNRQELVETLRAEVTGQLWSRGKFGVRALVDELRSEGRQAYIVSAAFQEVVEEIASELGWEGAVGTRCAVDDEGCYNGELDGPITHGAGKLEGARLLAHERGLDLEGAVALSDSHSDLPLLEAVARPICVDPDRRLRQWANERGWEVVSDRQLCRAYGLSPS